MSLRAQAPDVAIESVIDKGILRDRCRGYLGWTEVFFERVFSEYCKFLELMIALQDYDATKLCPSLAVEKLWQQHILDTRRYMEDCNAICGNFIHHDADSRLQQNKSRELRIQTTKIAYQARYCIECSGEIWEFYANATTVESATNNGFHGGDINPTEPRSVSVSPLQDSPADDVITKATGADGNPSHVASASTIFQSHSNDASKVPENAMQQQAQATNSLTEPLSKNLEELSNTTLQREVKATSAAAEPPSSHAESLKQQAHATSLSTEPPLNNSESVSKATVQQQAQATTSSIEPDAESSKATVQEQAQTTTPSTDSLSHYPESASTTVLQHAQETTASAETQLNQEPEPTSPLPQQAQATTSSTEPPPSDAELVSKTTLQKQAHTSASLIDPVSNDAEESSVATSSNKETQFEDAESASMTTLQQQAHASTLPSESLLKAPEPTSLPQIAQETISSTEQLVEEPELASETTLQQEARTSMSSTEQLMEDTESVSGDATLHQPQAQATTSTSEFRSETPQSTPSPSKQSSRPKLPTHNLMIRPKSRGKKSKEYNNRGRGGRDTNGLSNAKKPRIDNGPTRDDEETHPVQVASNRTNGHHHHSPTAGYKHSPEKKRKIPRTTLSWKEEEREDEERDSPLRRSTRRRHVQTEDLSDRALIQMYTAKTVSHKKQPQEEKEQPKSIVLVVNNRRLRERLDLADDVIEEEV